MRLTKYRRERTQINYEQLYANKFENLVEMDNFVET